MMTPETDTPLLMEGCEERQFFRNPEALQEKYSAYPLKMCRMIAEDTARRVEQSHEQFPFQFFRGDCHSHTVHSDGIGTVEQTAQMACAAGLDFQFVTDHWGVTQKEECQELGLWWGQEPVTQFHHMGILGLNHAFTPQMEFFKDFQAAKDLGATVFVPHPCGWWPDRVYDEEQKQILEELPDPFLMEICNGANNIVNAFDHSDDAALELWDRLLLEGKIVHALGNTDAHAPHCIGMVWNGVLASDCYQPTILEALRTGRNFVSDGPLLHIQLGETGMGDKAEAPNAELEITAADARGLLLIRFIGDGQELARWEAWNQTNFQTAMAVPPEIKYYVRAEVISRDGRRAFSNPIYFS